MEAAGRLVANRNVSGSGVSAPYGTVDDTGRVELSSEVVKKTGAAAMTKSRKTSTRKIREMSTKKVSRVLDIQMKNQIKNSFTGDPETDMQACFNRSTWSPAINMQQPLLGTSHLLLGDSRVRVLQNLRTSWITTEVPHSEVPQ